jgi:hypothetical protein
MKNVVGTALSAFALTAVTVLALAPTLAKADGANVTCTAEPKAKWMTHQAITEKAEAAGYHDVKKVKVEGTCYEVYARTKENKKAEVVMDPMTGAVVKTEIDD